ncbi:MAG TPA: L-threonylcarbamoyladenylate synthase [Phototrophicaceae bacterium]|nr:L-threonylcarbamoyladenylate synthase [Phototrophicaceae bacterium]
MGYVVETRILTVDSQNPEPELIQTAAEVLRRGGLVAFPTETVYGLGANALNQTAIERIYIAKRRPANDPLIVHIHAIEQLDLLTIQIPDAARRLAQAFWAGPLTLVLKRAANVPSNIASGLDTVAVRMPIHPVARALIQVSGFPIAAPSANTFTRPSATTAAHVMEDLSGRVDMVLDGGSTQIGLESTVVDLTQSIPVVLRPGGLSLEELQRIVPETEMHLRYRSENDPTNSPSPGTLTKHYSPRAQVMLFDGNPEVIQIAITDTVQRLVANGKKVGILATEEDASHFTDLGVRIISLGKSTDLAQIARVLFGAMRALDAQGVDTILVRNFAQEGLGVAIRDRLVRAAEGRIIQV